MTQKKGLKQFHGATVELEVQEFDGSGRFEGWATVYNVPIERWNGSVIMKAGMFSESIKEKGATQIRMLWQHNPDWPIGVYESFSESDYGLRAVGRLMVGEVKKADEVYAFMKRKAIGGLSVGFGIEEEERNKDTGLIEYTGGTHQTYGNTLTGSSEREATPENPIYKQCSCRKERRVSTV